MRYSAFSVSLLLFVAVLPVCPLFIHSAAASDDPYGPRFEFGGGIQYAQGKNVPQWSTKTYRMGTINTAARIFRGLALQGGFNASLGEDISFKSLAYDNDMILEKPVDSFYENFWAGLRYELPMEKIKPDFMKIKTVYGSIGISRARYSMTSTQWVRKGVRETDQPETKYHVADMSGPYAALGARWRLNTDITGDTGSWLSSYGVDAGVKYIRYTSCSPAHDAIMKPSPDESVIEMYIVLFLKIRWFE
ncbi:hypothetical protein LLG96_07060 [bacterium]|nr:hypothetical protein [bacterium]